MIHRFINSETDSQISLALQIGESASRLAVYQLSLDMSRPFFKPKIKPKLSIESTPCSSSGAPSISSASDNYNAVMGQSDSHTGDDSGRVSFDRGGGSGDGGGLEATEDNFREAIT